MTDFENLIQNAPSGGWEWFEGADEKIKKALELSEAKETEDRAAIASAWAQFAETPGGRKALDNLFANTLYRTVFFVSLGLDMQSMATFGAFREGQNAVAHMIASAIAEGRGETTKPRDV
ncbi:hypothetical protein FMN63_25050 [Stappia sp. BW2]|uniref:hypothetical protein n=1 Tax=Stappia sp. BW2 TaxID=2592622 RepID=UPI0011DEB333|nr:hypothetical protein [Stappia sp. BW2]TYC65654.1 hypothetical protein FMN63_25050 [Stappia sp. BW2]